MNTFSMTYEQVDSTVTQLKNYADSIREELDKVTQEANTVTEDGWQGQAATTYKETFETLRPSFDRFYATIMDCIEYLNTAMGKNKSTDSNVSATFTE